MRRPSIERIIASVGKLRILNILVKTKELNITSIVNRTKLSHTRVKKLLRELQDMDLLMEKRFGRIKIYKINDTREEGIKIIEFLQYWQDKEEENNI